MGAKRLARKAFPKILTEDFFAADTPVA